MSISPVVHCFHQVTAPLGALKFAVYDADDRTEWLLRACGLRFTYGTGSESLKEQRPIDG